MSRDELRLFSYEILVLRGPPARARTICGGWCNGAACSTGPGRASTTSSPRRLARLGYLEVRARSRARRGTAAYTLTDKGLTALREWAATPVHFTPVKSELLTRLLITDLVGEATTRASVLALRDEIADLFERVGEAESSAEALPHRRKYLLLIMGFMRDLLDLHVELVDRVERELEPGDGDDQPKNASARA